MLTKNIILPEYQRSFVWNKKSVLELKQAFEQDDFVPPVTIGLYKDKVTNSTMNLILDGQQRLTSILLSYLNLFPIKEKFKGNDIRFASENDDEVDDDESTNGECLLKWTYSTLLGEDRRKGKILERVRKKETDCYEPLLNEQLDDSFFKTKYLGFCYLIPDLGNNSQKEIQQKYYATVFRSINIKGQTLLPEESRKALYYLSPEFEPFFSPKNLNYWVDDKRKGKSPLDFVRYLSLLSQYKKEGYSDKIARGYKSKIEAYYEEYIYSVIGTKSSELFVDFSSLFPLKDYLARINTFLSIAKQLYIPSISKSIIDVDIYFFGLIYEIVYEAKSLRNDMFTNLSSDILSTIEEIKTDDSHKRAPGAFKYLRSRITKSIEIYKKYEL